MDIGRTFILRAFDDLHRFPEARIAKTYLWAAQELGKAGHLDADTVCIFKAVDRTASTLEHPNNVVTLVNGAIQQLDGKSPQVALAGVGEYAVSDAQCEFQAGGDPRHAADAAKISRSLLQAASQHGSHPVRKFSKIALQLAAQIPQPMAQSIALRQALKVLTYEPHCSKGAGAPVPAEYLLADWGNKVVTLAGTGGNWERTLHEAGQTPHFTQIGCAVVDQLARPSNPDVPQRALAKTTARTLTTLSEENEKLGYMAEMLGCMSQYSHLAPPEPGTAPKT